VISLEGFIDIHLHTSPDVRPRKLDDLQTARAAAKAKMRAIVIKSHVTLTADRAAIANTVVQNIEVFGSLTLNDHVGGLNPLAVEAAVQMGAKIIWLPTISAANHRRYHHQEGGIIIQIDDKETARRLSLIIETLRDNDVILGTGHISGQETKDVVTFARAMGLKKLLITHPEVPWIAMSVAEQAELQAKGAWFERCFASTLPIGGGVPLERIAQSIREVGVETTIISTDFGAQSIAAPTDGYRQYLTALSAQGFGEDQLRRMGIQNPAQWLKLDL
jgi:hypothetical protein